MTRLQACGGDERVALYFYDELTPRDRAAAEDHFAACAECRDALADLRVISTALASRRVEAPDGGWQPFMLRLDARLDETARRTAEPPNRRTTVLMKLAAAITLVAAGAVGGWLLGRDEAPRPDQQAVVAGPQIDRAIADAGGAGLERARVVLAGLAQKEEGAAWSLERRMAATLLPELRLIRQAAADRGRGDLADVLFDVETLLLQASYAETDDAETLARLRGMIDRRDVLMRLSLASTGEAPRAAAGMRKGL